MPTGLNGTGSTGGTPLSTPSFGIGGGTNTTIGAGKVVFGISDPSKSLQQSAGAINAGFIGLGKGVVSLVENLPVVGPIAKPLIGFAGGIADATIGFGVSKLEGIRVGDKSLAQLGVQGLEAIGDVTVKPAVELLSLPSRIVEQKVAEARILNTQNNRNDAISMIFGNAPRSAINAMNSGATLEEAALELANSNAGFSENGAANFLYSLVLDPMNLILPGIGKAASIGKEAALLNRMAVDGLKGAEALRAAESAAKLAGNTVKAAQLAEDAKFLEKWQFAGKVYEATLGKASNVTKRFTSNIVKEAALGWTRVYNTKVVGGLLDDIEKVVGREIADRGLKNYAATFYNGIKSAAVRVRTAMYRSRAEDLADNITNDLVEKIKEVGAAQALSTPAARGETIGSLLDGLKIPKQQVDDIIASIEDRVGRNIRNDEILKADDINKFKQQIAAAEADLRITENKDLILAAAEYRTGANARYAADDATRLFRQDKLDEIPLAQNPTLGIPELTKHLVAGFGITEQQALEIAQRQFATHANDVRALADILSMAKGAAFGQAMRETALVRSLFDAGDDLSRITLISARSLTKEAAYALRQEIEKYQGLLKDAEKIGDTAAIKSTKDAMKRLADKMVEQYDEFSVFANDTYTYESVFKFLKESEGIVVTELDKATAFRIQQNLADPNIAKVADLMRRMEAYGYRLGIAPKEGVLRKVQTLVADRYGREKLVELTAPFVDTLDHLAVTTDFAGTLDKALAGSKLRQGTLGKIWESVSRPYGAEVTKSNVIERFVTGMVNKTGISVNQAREIMSRISSLAAERNVRPQALFMAKGEVEQIFRDVMKDQYGRLRDAGTDPIREILSAAAGDWSVAGLTSGFTGRIKAIKPEITVLTDIIYPEVRFGKLNPYFNLVLERAETAIQMFTHGIKGEFAREAIGDVRGTVARRAYLSNTNVVREINDAVMDNLTSRSVKNLTYAANASQSFSSRVLQKIRNAPQFLSRERLKRMLSIDVVRDNKRIARDIMADRFAAREFIDILEQAAPGKLNELAIHYGVRKADDVVELLIAEYLIQSDPVHFAAHVEELGAAARGFSKKALVDAGMDPKNAEDLAAAVMGAYEVALLRGSRLADKAQYFASQRSWLERSLNHPFLGLYPYSYMTQKAIPSLLKLMFAPRVFGQVAPGFWYNNWQKAQEAMQNQVNTDENVLLKLTQNDALLWLVTTILPTTPDTSGFSAPAWLRRGIIQPGLKGEPITLGSFAPTLTEIGSTVVRGSALGQMRTTLEGIQAASDITKINPTLSESLQGAGENIQQTVLKQLSSEIRQP